MGRAGRGGGSHSSGGGRSRSRSSGGHRVSSGRAGGGSSGSHFRHSGVTVHNYHHHYGSPQIRGESGTFATIVYCICIVVLLVNLVSSLLPSNEPKSTIQRTRLETGNAYINDCVIDELDWVENESYLESGLKQFWEETGVQPYIILKEYDSTLLSDADKETWATNYYDTHFDNEDIFLFVYFGEPSDDDVGYMCYANGYQTSSVMDSEAVEIFWNYIDRYWHADMDTDEMFIAAYSDTAETIMQVSKTGIDVVYMLVVLVIVAVLGFVLILALYMKFKRDKEKAAEEQKILDTPINDMLKENTHVDDKYL